MTNLDYLISEPRIVMILFRLDAADFNFLLNASGLSKADLSSHMSRLKRARYVEPVASPDGEIRRVAYRLTPSGQWAARDCLHWLRAVRSARRCRRPAVFSMTDHYRHPVQMEEPVQVSVMEVAQP